MRQRHLPATYAASRRWTAADAEIVLAALAASGESVATFAAREGLDPQRLYSWRRRLAGVVGDVVTAPAFVEIRPAVPADRHRLIEIELRSGRLLRVPESIDCTILSRLVAALEQDLTC